MFKYKFKITHKRYICIIKTKIFIKILNITHRLYFCLRNYNELRLGENFLFCYETNHYI